MSKQRRMRKMAKNIASMPQHKKRMAEFLAKENASKIDLKQVQEMLSKGHRGYLAMSEEKLGKLFDQHFDHLTAELKKAEDSGLENGTWAQRQREERIKIAREKVSAAEAIYDEIFEEVFL